jgi:hypothetical protein
VSLEALPPILFARTKHELHQCNVADAMLSIGGWPTFPCWGEKTNPTFAAWVSLADAPQGLHLP